MNAPNMELQAQFEKHYQVLSKESMMLSGGFEKLESYKALASMGFDIAPYIYACLSGRWAPPLPHYHHKTSYEQQAIENNDVPSHACEMLAWQILDQVLSPEHNHYPRSKQGRYYFSLAFVLDRLNVVVKNQNPKDYLNVTPHNDLEYIDTLDICHIVLPLTNNTIIEFDYSRINSDVCIQTIDSLDKLIDWSKVVAYHWPGKLQLYYKDKINFHHEIYKYKGLHWSIVRYIPDKLDWMQVAQHTCLTPFELELCKAWIPINAWPLIWKHQDVPASFIQRNINYVSTHEDWLNISSQVLSEDFIYKYHDKLKMSKVYSNSVLSYDFVMANTHWIDLHQFYFWSPYSKQFVEEHRGRLGIPEKL